MDIYPLTPASLPTYIDDLARIYSAAFSQPPYNESYSVLSRFCHAIEAHSVRSGFTGFFVKQPDSDEIIGFTYGYTSLPGQWWHDVVTRDLRPTLIQNWFSDAFELVDLALLPEEQGNGFGGSLFDHLIESLPHRTALLSTIRETTDAYHLYQKRGWQVLNPTLDFPGINRPYMLMGKELR